MSYSYLIDDSVYGSVKPHRGIRQGDPISPYLFILCGEVLSGLCRKAKLDGSMRGIRVARGSSRVNHLLFADDTMMFCNSLSTICLALIHILREYEKVSGQKVNIAKSSVTFSSQTPQDVKTTAKNILGIQKEGGVGKYLDLPEHFGRRKKTYSPRSSTGSDREQPTCLRASSREMGSSLCSRQSSKQSPLMLCLASSYQWVCVIGSSRSSPASGGISLQKKGHVLGFLV